MKVTLLVVALGTALAIAEISKLHEARELGAARGGDDSPTTSPATAEISAMTK